MHHTLRARTRSPLRPVAAVALASLLVGCPTPTVASRDATPPRAPSASTAGACDPAPRARATPPEVRVIENPIAPRMLGDWLSPVNPDGPRVAFALIGLHGEGDVAWPPERHRVRVELGVNSPRTEAPSPWDACRTVRLDVDGRDVALPPPRYRRSERDGVWGETVDVDVAPAALAALRDARCVTVRVCGDVLPLHPAQVEGARAFVRRYPPSAGAPR